MSFPEIKLFSEAVALSWIIRLVTFFLPMKWYLALLGKPLENIPAVVEKCCDRGSTAYMIKRAVERASKYVPWDVKCLVQAITARNMLRRRNISSVVYIGVSKENKWKAHAWLICGEMTVTGKKEKEMFTVIAAFE